MKALLIGFENEENKMLLQMVLNQLTTTDYHLFKESHNLMEVLTSDGPFSYVVVSLENRELNIQEKYDHINDIIGKRPYIFLGSISSIKSKLTEELINDQKINFVLELPIEPTNLRKHMGQCELWIKNEEFDQSIKEFPREEMQGLRIKNFFLFEQLPYDIYLELTPGKYGKIISKNKNYTHQLVHSYSKKNVKFLYLRKDEHLKLLDTSIKHLITFYKSKSIDKSKLFIVHLKTIFFIQEFVRHLSVTEEIIELVKLLTESISNLVRSQKTIFNLLAEFDQLSQIGFAEAALLTAYLCEGILAEMEWNADMTKGRLILCAIFQDIHLGNDELIKVRTLDDPILRKFSEEDQQHFREHPKAAGEIAKLFSGYTEVDFILKEHHEHPLGEGFPNGINTSGLTTISSIFIIATHFASKIARSNEGMLAQVETIKFLKRNYVLGNFKEPMKALSKILNVQ